MANRNNSQLPALLIALVVYPSVFGQQTTTAPTTNVGASLSSNVQHVDFNMSPTLRPPDVSPSGTLSENKAENVINTVCSGNNPQIVPYNTLLNNGATYALINIVKFAKNGDGTRQAASNNWYIYSRNNHKRWYSGWPHGWTVADFDGATRLYGARQLLLITIFLNLQNPDPTGVSYALTVTKTTPTNVPQPVLPRPIPTLDATRYKLHTLIHPSKSILSTRAVPLRARLTLQ
jgi:hypothetical protein